MLDVDLKNQLQAYLTRVSRPVEIVASLDDGDTARQMRDAGRRRSTWGHAAHSSAGLRARNIGFSHWAGTSRGWRDR